MPLSYEQEELLEKVKKAWEREPDLRFCQLVENVADPMLYPGDEWQAQPASDAPNHCIYYTPDKDFRNRLEARLED